MTKLSVNINKIATLRNARGGDVPNVVQVAKDIERFGAHGITVHPRPDERHIRRSDVYELKAAISTEFNIEGYPSEDFIKMVLDVKPHQVTLVPDPPHVLTSNAGWNTIEHKDLLIPIIGRFNDAGIRTSIFVETIESHIEAAAETGTQRIELYTESYAKNYLTNREQAVKPFVICAKIAQECDLEVNAGHDLSLDNLAYFSQQVKPLHEVSIGHALISDALYYGLQNTVNMYQRELGNS